MARNQLQPTKAQLAKIPALYAQENEHDPIVYIRYFFGGRGAFYATEMNQETGLMFGYMVSPLGPDCDEFGYSDLMTMTTGNRFNKIAGVERDQYFSPKPLTQALTQNGDPLPAKYLS